MLESWYSFIAFWNEVQDLSSPYSIGVLKSLKTCLFVQASGVHDWSSPFLFYLLPNKPSVFAISVIIFDPFCFIILF